MIIFKNRKITMIQNDKRRLWQEWINVEDLTAAGSTKLHH
uniref:Uncharacterized protein n=1 Tax=Nelumbo nucifera TaxID=4432 RepID=A0A822YD22_NELNU|nr:TPA_asm: hypothetical protein HUJ06_030424 [Nelumbo nucifera]